MKSDDLKGFYLAVILSIIVIFITNSFFPAKKPLPEENAVAEVSSDLTANSGVDSLKTTNQESGNDKQQILTLDEVLTNSPQISLENDALTGTIRVKGARIDNLWLKKYKQTMEPDSKNVEFFAPAKTADPYYAEFGWLAGSKDIKVPNSQTLWTVKGSKLTPDSPIVLEWDNGQGLKFINKISLDNNYMFGFEQAVENQTAQDVTLFPYGLIARVNENPAKSNIVHEGPIGVFNNTLEEVKYKDLEKHNEEYETTGGWFGYSDRYWFSAIVLNPQADYKVKFSKTGTLYQTDFVGSPMTIAAGSLGTNTNRLYAGAKEIKLLDSYTKDQHIAKFDLAVDFGWYYFLTKPFFYILDFLYHLIGNMGWAILLFAALLRLVMFPIANKSYASMAKMKMVQPKLKELQERYGDDKAKLQQETMALYSREKINPASGCLPMFIQIPVFFSLYKVLNISIEIRHAPFAGWIKDLSAPDPLTISQWTGLTFLPAIIDIGIWPIFMGLTMYIQQKLNPAPTNKDQARIFAFLPLIFTFMMGHFASGLVIYWTFSNLMSILQQRAIMVKNKEKK